MQPKDPRQNSPIIPSRSYIRPNTYAARQKTNDAAANIIRDQINNIYQGSNSADAPVEDTNPYDRTHEADRTEIEEDQWKHYHSAWQDYYQQYYERYYLGEIYRMRQTLDTHSASTQQAQVHAAELTDEEAEADEAYHDLRSSLLKNVRKSATKVRGSRHFMPLVAAACTMVLFLFIEFNPILVGTVKAYVSPGDIDPANIIVDPTINIPVSSDPRLIIPKINVDVPVIYDTKPDQASQLKAMESGVAWFGIPGASSHPGQVGNTVLSGHSSNDLFDGGDYKFIFAQLDRMQPGDTFYINYKGTRYTYNIVKKEVVAPTDVQKLVYPTTKPVVTLITCTPIGTSLNRLLVTAEQVSPNPAEAEGAPSASTGSSSSTAMPGNSPSVLNRLFGG